MEENKDLISQDEGKEIEKQKQQEGEAASDEGGDAGKAPEAAEPADAGASPEKDIEAKGFDYQALEKEYFDNKGELSKATLEKLNAQGFSDEFINDFIAGKKALYEQEINDLAQAAGGREQYNQVIEWASKNLEPAVIQSINSVTDKNILKNYIIPSLKAQMEEKEGKMPQVKIQGMHQAPAEDLFESQEQMFAAIRDPRYRTDSAYAAKVTAKIRASREAGINLGI